MNKAEKTVIKRGLKESYLGKMLHDITEDMDSFSNNELETLIAFVAVWLRTSKDKLY